MIKKAVYIALGVNSEGKKDVLELLISENEDAKFLMSVLADIQTRGAKDVFIFCVDGLTGFSEAIEAVYPKSKVQLCIVHMMKNSLKHVSYKDRKEVAAELKK